VRAVIGSWAEFHFTARNTPQQTHLDELAFETITNRWHALMNAANVPMEIYHIRTEAFKSMTTFLDDGNYS